jgi:2-keto-4-pentenoate hydratase/2-oxohepta-3-ene-1,7-dioic acid hydratase in catechol pathway
MAVELLNSADLLLILSTIEEMTEALQGVPLSLQETVGRLDCLQLLVTLSAICCVARLIEGHVDELRREERELASEVYKMAVAAIHVGEQTLPRECESQERFRQEARETFEWFEHLLNRIDPKLGAKFYEINERIDRS